MEAGQNNCDFTVVDYIGHLTIGCIKVPLMSKIELVNQQDLSPL